MTTYYHQATNSYVGKYSHFTLADIQYPENWLELASADDISGLGLVEVTTVGERGDDRFNWVSETLEGSVRTIVNTPKDAAAVAEIVKAALITAVQSHLDADAQELGYDDIKTAATYAGEPAVPRFQNEGIALRSWRSLVWEHCHVVMNAVTAGERAVPTAAELIAELPVLQMGAA
jgi:hypothetical protein